MVQPKVIKTAVITTSVVAIGLGVGLTVGRSKSNEPPSSVQSDGGSPDVEYVDPSPKVSENFLTNDILDRVDPSDIIDKAQRDADVTGPQGGYEAYGDGEVSDVLDRQSASKAEKGSGGSYAGKSGKSNSASKGSSHTGGVVKCIGSGKSGKSNSDGKSGKSNSNGGGSSAGKSGKSNSRNLR